jgi:hypothetical protein
VTCDAAAAALQRNAAMMSVVARIIAPVHITLSLPCGEQKRQNRRVKHSRISLAIFAMLSASLALAEDFKTINGKEYKNATVTQVEADGIVVKTKTGISKLYFTELPEDVQKRYHYDPANAAAAQAAQLAATQRANQAIEESNKRAEVEKQKVEAEKRKALEVSQPAQSARGSSRQNMGNRPRIVGVGGVNGLEVEVDDKRLQLEAEARAEAMTPQEKQNQYARDMKKYEGAKQVAARRGLDANLIVPPRYGQVHYDPFAKVVR